MNIHAKTFLAMLIILYSVGSTRALAETPNNRAIGRMYTTALNMVETKRAEDVSKPAYDASMRIEHGQIIIVMEGVSGPVTMVYDPIAHQIISDDTPT